MTDKKETLAEDTADDSKTPAIANKSHSDVKGISIWQKLYGITCPAVHISKQENYSKIKVYLRLVLP